MPWSLSHARVLDNGRHRLRRTITCSIHPFQSTSDTVRDAVNCFFSSSGKRNEAVVGWLWELGEGGADRGRGIVGDRGMHLRAHSCHMFSIVPLFPRGSLWAGTRSLLMIVCESSTSTSDSDLP